MQLSHLRALVVAAVTLAAVAAGPTAPPARAAAGCRVTYAVTSQWQGGFGASVSVINLGDSVTSWKVSWSFAAGQTVAQAWNGTAVQAGSAVTVTNASWNGTLGNGGSVSFGFTGTSGDTNPVPTDFALNGTACTGSTTSTPTPSTPTPSLTASATPSPSAPTAAWPPSSQFTNPVLWEDFPDLDVFRVGDTYYYSSSNFHYSPGAPVMRSYDLVNWEVAGHSIPVLDFASTYDLTGGRAYVKGTWASFMNYRPSNKTFYWGGCIEGRTYLYTATSVDGTWQKHTPINTCYYDAGMLVDDDDTMYVAYGNTTINVAQLSKDGLSQVRTQAVFTSPSSVGTVEGSRMYRRGGAYYILVTHPANAEYVLRSTSGPFGPYTMQPLVQNATPPISGGGNPHQGGLVQTQNGEWYYLAFEDAYPGGRVPVLAPVTWTSSGWPVVQLSGNSWSPSYPYPNVPRPPRQVKRPTGTDTFSSTTLSPEWEWNHNPDNTKWSAGSGLRLQTATVTPDLYSARNTLTHRILGPTSTATVSLDYSAMKDGDRAGLAMLRDSSAWIGVERDGASTRVVMTTGLTMDTNWNTTGTGTEVASTSVSGGRVWLRVNADIRPGGSRQARFSYSTDGVTFTSLGSGFTLTNDWRFFLGYRFAIFNHATKALGGSVTVDRFDLTTP